jgi:1-acyl-sn-glycerol-3-phosphate acyltransferase
VAALYRDLDMPCTPMATNSGVHLNAQGIVRRTGVIVYEVLPPIPPGLKRQAFMAALETSIETASNALLEAGI